MGETEETENDHVQEVMAQRSRKKNFSGCCGGWYGSKVWHSTDQYRRVIWQCNGKYKGKNRPCKTPHLTEDDIKAAFIRMVNKLVAERGSLIADLREIQKTYSVTAELERMLRELDERMNTEADAVQDLIAINARAAQNQDDYNARYKALVSQYETTKAERDRVAEEIRQKGIRRREFERFITTLEKLPEEVTTSEESMWSSLVEYITVKGKDDLRFTQACGTEM